ncbi:MAG: prepilin-type N-terminal cleavage/methylation domain-containing protein [Nitrospira sp.]|nr:prepilin-type N-terminal cleavage/methylation domain-containing protein [Nitrospira sp.]
MTRPAHTFKPIAHGFTLVELMVAMTIGLIILGAVAQIFATSRGTYALEEGLARLQENGRFAMNFVTEDIRMAGYTGCARLSTGQIGNMVDPPADPTTFNPDGIRGHASTGAGTNLGDWNPALPATYFSNGEVEAGTDVIIIQHASSLGTHLTGNLVPSNANIQILNTAQITSQIAAGDVLMVADCKAADIFKATSVSGGGKVTIAHSNSGNTSPFLDHAYGNEAELMKLVSRVYFIGTGVSTGTSASTAPALFRKDLVAGVLQAQELVDGVEDMRVFYGEDTAVTADSAVNIFRPANTVTDWSKVVSVRIGLLLRTPHESGGDFDTNTYDVAGATVDPTDDRRQRRVFTTIIQLRN